MQHSEGEGSEEDDPLDTFMADIDVGVARAVGCSVRS